MIKIDFNLADYIVAGYSVKVLNESHKNNMAILTTNNGTVIYNPDNFKNLQGTVSKSTLSDLTRKDYQFNNKVSLSIKKGFDVYTLKVSISDIFVTLWVKPTDVKYASKSNYLTCSCLAVSLISDLIVKVGNEICSKADDTYEFLKNQVVKGDFDIFTVSNKGVLKHCVGNYGFKAVDGKYKIARFNKPKEGQLKCASNVFVFELVDSSELFVRLPLTLHYKFLEHNTDNYA